ncbi:MAG: FeoA family protein [Candidatus Sumerlaeota bacterium]|nr:FeoA family protein [Candidatus Sumerlaeota bacterium]
MKQATIDLWNLPPGEKAIVVAIYGGIGVTVRLDSMGIRPGIALQKISRQPLRGPVVVQVGNNRIALGFGVACKVQVAIGGTKENAT